LEQLRPLLSMPSVACTHDDELSFFHARKGSMRNEKPSR
jgi:hypothetical protein